MEERIAIALIWAEPGYPADLGLVIRNADEAIQAVHTVRTGPYDYIAIIEDQGAGEIARAIRAILTVDGVKDGQVCYALRTHGKHEKLVTVAIGQGSCQLLASLSYVPEVGGMIVITNDQVLGAKGLGMGLVGRPIVVTARGEDIEVEGKMVPHIWAKTV